jgi:hypothetical protein
VDRLNANDPGFGIGVTNGNGSMEQNGTKPPLFSPFSGVSTMPSSLGNNGYYYPTPPPPHPPLATMSSYYNPTHASIGHNYHQMGPSEYGPYSSSMWSSNSSYGPSVSTTITHSQNSSSSSSYSHHEEGYDPIAPGIGFHNGKNYNGFSSRPQYPPTKGNFETPARNTLVPLLHSYEPLELMLLDEYQPHKVVSFL